MITSSFYFVGKDLKPLQNSDCVDKRFAIFVGNFSYFNGCGQRITGKQYVSFNPMFFNVSQEEALEQISIFLQKNPLIKKASLLEIEDIRRINDWGKDFDVKISDTRTKSTFDDWHGKSDGFYYFTTVEKLDKGETKTNAYIKFFVVDDVKDITVV
ncbi:MAG: hypothetical protein IKW39_01765 [Alphaproteobacteria bacterium]|nr:hypothetical protein [Alphaproteobacteria bacterium]